MPAKKGNTKVAASRSGAKRVGGKKAKGGSKLTTRRSGASKKGGKTSAATAGTLAAGEKVLIINVIPKSMSFETNNDSEPNLAVNPSNPLQIAASAFTPDPFGNPNAPIFVSTDGGMSWALNSIVPGGNPSFGTGDITIRFGQKSNRLYAGILRGDVRLRMNILRTNDFTNPTQMSVLVSRDRVDQPYIQTAAASGPNAQRDFVFVGNNDFNTNDGRTATIDLSRNAAVGSGTFRAVRIDPRANTSGADGPSIRPTAHADGTVYGAFFHFLSAVGPLIRRDVVVVRDDNFGTGITPFTALRDPNNNLPGRIVAPNRLIPFMNLSFMGQERIGSSLSITVDPRPGQSSTVYIAWADRVGTNDYTLHLRRSTDKGVTWSSSDLLTITNATNPALAINSDGKIGFLYQQFTGPFSPQVVTAANRWETHLRRSTDGISWDDLVLCRTAANMPPTGGELPYLGDYVHLQAVGRDFFGIFSANNTPDPANFPAAQPPAGRLVFQRNHDFATRRLFDVDGTTRVDISIDPFFFIARE